MLNVRRNVFETNSSSSHSIALKCDSDEDFYTKEEARKELSEYIKNDVLDLTELVPVEFSWGVEIYEDFYHKLFYALITFYTSDDVLEDERSDFNRLITWLKQFLGVNEIIYPINTEEAWDGCSQAKYYFGRIDHQSTDTLIEALEEDPDNHTVIDFITNQNIILIIDNDNH